MRKRFISDNGISYYNREMYEKINREFARLFGNWVVRALLKGNTKGDKHEQR